MGNVQQEGEPFDENIEVTLDEADEKPVETIQFQRQKYEPSLIEFNSDIITNPSHDMKSVITLDLMDFDLKFPCPICSELGEEQLISVVTLSDHMGQHKYQAVLMERMGEKYLERERMKKEYDRRWKEDGDRILQIAREKTLREKSLREEKALREKILKESPLEIDVSHDEIIEKMREGAISDREFMLQRIREKANTTPNVIEELSKDIELSIRRVDMISNTLSKMAQSSSSDEDDFTAFYPKPFETTTMKQIAKERPETPCDKNLERAVKESEYEYQFTGGLSEEAAFELALKQSMEESAKLDI